MVNRTQYPRSVQLELMRGGAGIHAFIQSCLRRPLRLGGEGEGLQSRGAHVWGNSAGQGGEAFGIAFKPEAGAPGGSPRSEAAPTAALSVTFNDLYAGRCPLLAATATAMATHHCYCYCRSSCLLLTLTTTVLLH